MNASVTTRCRGDACFGRCDASSKPVNDVDRPAVKRHVAASLDGTWSLSPTGAGPTVKISGNRSVWTAWTTPGDDSSVVEYRSSRNDFKISAPGFGVILHDAGLTYADGTHYGVFAQLPFTPEVAVTLCAALTCD